MYRVGDIILVYAHLKNSKKYHLCLIKPTKFTAGLFLFLNSENRFNNAYAVDGTRIPELPRTSSGNRYICVQRIPYSESHFQSHKPEKICELAMDICEELLEFVKHTPSIERRHKDQIINAIKKIINIRRSSN